MLDKKHGLWALAMAICGMLTACVLGPEKPPTGYSLKRQTDVGAGVGDYNLGLDRDGNVFVTDSSHVSIFNPKTGRIVARISGLYDARAIAIDDNRAFIAERRPDRLIAVDKRTSEKLFEVPVGGGPEAVVLDRSSKRVFTLNEGKNDVTAVEANSGKRLGTVPLGGRPGAAIGDGNGMVFVNVIDKGEIVAFDAVALEVKIRRPLPGCSHPSGISADLAHWLIFSACENGVIAVSEMYSGRAVGTIATAAETKDVKYDSIMKRIFALSELGEVTVAREINPKSFSVLGNISVGSCGLSMQQDENRHRLYITTSDENRSVDCQLAKQFAGDHTLLEFGL